MKINIIDQNLKSVGDIEIVLPANFVDSKESLLRYIKVYINNQHQWTNSTKTRAEVSGGGKKPWAQKGTGRARAGSIRSPLWVGGGIAHGPKPKSVQDKISKKVVKQAFSTALNALLKSKSVTSLDLDKISKPSTKIANNIAKFMDTKKNILFIHNNDQNVYLSFRNLKHVTVKDVTNVNAYDLSLAKKVIIQKSSVDKLNERIK